MNTLQWKVEQLPDQAHRVVLSGAITEDADLRSLATLDGPGALSFDMAAVDQINSCGVREWIHFVRRLADADRRFELVRCSPAIVRQLNTIANFRGDGQIRSVMLPYYCPSCRNETHRPLELAGGAPREIPEELPCPTCSGTMEFDDISATYLSFSR